MACTVAVEEVIDAHYQKYIAALDQTASSTCAPHLAGSATRSWNTAIPALHRARNRLRPIACCVRSLSGRRAAIALSERI